MEQEIEVIKSVFLFCFLVTKFKFSSFFLKNKTEDYIRN